MTILVAADGFAKGKGEQGVLPRAAKYSTIVCKMIKMILNHSGTVF